MPGRDPGILSVVPKMRGSSPRMTKRAGLKPAPTEFSSRG